VLSVLLDGKEPLATPTTKPKLDSALYKQSDGSSDEGSLHIDTDSKPARSAKGKKEGVGSAAGILDLLQASEEVGALEYNPSRPRGAPARPRAAHWRPTVPGRTGVAARARASGC